MACQLYGCNSRSETKGLPFILAGYGSIGDPGSFFFKDLSVEIYLHGKVQELYWYAEDYNQPHVDHPARWSLYQDSSGGENWNSPNHVRRDGKLTVSFSGYQAYELQNVHRKVIAEGARANPFIRLANSSGWVAAGLKDFWQNFPKALRVDDNQLSIGLFPRECASGFCARADTRLPNAAGRPRSIGVAGASWRPDWGRSGRWPSHAEIPARPKVRGRHSTSAVPTRPLCRRPH